MPVSHLGALIGLLFVAAEQNYAPEFPGTPLQPKRQAQIVLNQNIYISTVQKLNSHWGNNALFSFR